MRDLILESPIMHNIVSLAKRVAPSEATIFLFGESGTGKEVIARHIHTFSPRSHHPFLPVNCGAIPQTMAEALLFGHERGAFTGATERRPGFFEQAHGGTLFLDEIGEMSLDMQTRLLRILEEGVVRRLGGKTEVAVDVRLVTATNRDLGKLVADGKFRSDLFYRLYVVPIFLPPLRERIGDIVPLARHFAKTANGKERASTLSPKALEKLLSHPWPGNVRELKNAIQRAVLLCDGDTIDVDDIHLIPLTGNSPHCLNTVERSAIVEALARHSGNNTRVATELGIARTTLSAKLRKYEIDVMQFRKG